MTYDDVLETAKKMGLSCRVCPDCNGLACRGEVPGVGAKGSGKSFTNCVNFLKSIDINLDAVYESHGQDTCCRMFGRTWSMPVFGAPVGGAVLNYKCQTMDDGALVSAQLSGALQAGTVAFTPDAPMGGFFEASIRALKEAGGVGIPTIKPWKNEIVLEKLRLAEDAGAIAAAMDVDSAGLINLKIMGTPVDPKSPQDIREITAATALPFFIKGVMTARAALLCQDAGAKGIVQSTDLVPMGFAGDELTLLHHPTGQNRTRTVDWLVLAVPANPVEWLYHDLVAAGVSVERAGDCIAPRRAHAAVVDGGLSRRARCRAS